MPISPCSGLSDKHRLGIELLRERISLYCYDIPKGNIVCNP